MGLQPSSFKGFIFMVSLFLSVRIRKHSREIIFTHDGIVQQTIPSEAVVGIVMA